MIHKTFAVEGTADIDIRIESGRVEVRDGSSDKVDVQVDTRLPGFIVDQRGNTVVVSSNRDGGWLARGTAYVVVEAPPGSDLTISVSSASVDVGVDSKKVEIKTASGDIDLQSADTVVIRTASGDARIEEVEQALRFTSASGDLYLEKCRRGSAAVSTASGDVRIEECDATISVNSASGDIWIDRFTGRSADFKSMSGNIELGIPPRSTVELDVTTRSGKVRLPEPGPRREEPERYMSIKARLISGDFRLERA